MTTKRKYIVLVVVESAGKGTAYLQPSTRFAKQKYRWGKTLRERATVFSESGARAAAKKYGGKAVKAVKAVKA